MAIHTLGSQDFRNLKFSEELWKNVDTSSIASLVYDFYPAISRVTSKSENRSFTWLFLRVLVDGLGSVAVTYPYVDSSDQLLILKNVSFSQIPYVILKTQGTEKSTFKCWKDSVTGKVVSQEKALVLTKDVLSDVTGLIAEFEEYEDNLGF